VGGGAQQAQPLIARLGGLEEQVTIALQLVATQLLPGSTCLSVAQHTTGTRRIKSARNSPARLTLRSQILCLKNCSSDVLMACCAVCLQARCQPPSRDADDCIPAEAAAQLMLRLCIHSSFLPPNPLANGTMF
jgi:hypothetical protein